MIEASRTRLVEATRELSLGLLLGLRLPLVLRASGPGGLVA